MPHRGDVKFDTGSGHRRRCRSILRIPHMLHAGSLINRAPCPAFTSVVFWMRVLVKLLKIEIQYEYLKNLRYYGRTGEPTNQLASAVINGTGNILWFRLILMRDALINNRR